MDAKPEFYNRISCRSPMRRDQRITQVNKPVTNNITNNVITSRASNRTVKRNVNPDKKEEENFYKVVTQTPSGQTVKVPTAFSFIKFKPKPCVNIKINYIKLEKKCSFVEALDIYENNQSYLLQEIEDNKNIKNTLQELNTWFNKFKEPKPKSDVKEWQERIQFQKTNGYSSYLDKELIPFL
jgi:hypothetical protein